MRNIDWQRALSAVIRSRKSEEFVWGINDCCLFASDCAVAVCGKDPAEEYRGRYTTEIGAKRVLTSTHGSLSKAFDAVFEQINPTLAQRGDLILYESDLGETVGVMWASGLWSVGVNGVGVVEQYQSLIAWRVE